LWVPRENDPSRLAGADESDLLRIDVGAGSQGVHGPDGIGRQQVEVAVVAWTALSLGLSPAPLVVGEEPDTALDERPGQELCAKRSPDTGARFNFWHPDLVTLHVWLWYPNPAGLYSGTNPYIRPFNHS
jgi:hypothetical protein